MSRRKCAILDCNDALLPMHIFPNPVKNLKQFKLWLSATGDVNLKHKGPRSVYISHRICHKHFDVKYYAPNNKLSKDALTTLNLSEPIDGDITVESKPVFENIDLVPATLSNAPVTVQIPLEMPAPYTTIEYSPRKRVTPSKEKHLQTESPEKEEQLEFSIQDMPSTSTGISTIQAVQGTSTDLITVSTITKTSTTEKRTLQSTITILADVLIRPAGHHLMEHSPSIPPLSSISDQSTTKHDISDGAHTDLALPLLKHDDFTKNQSEMSEGRLDAESQLLSPNEELIRALTPTPHKILRSACVNSRRDLTPRKNVLYGAVKHLCKKLKSTRTAKDTFKKRLFAAEKYSKEMCLEEKLSTLNAAAAQLIRLQFREGGKSIRQRRFTENEKMMALSLYKQSPKSYRFLANWFVLPSKSTLNLFLNKISFNAGINQNIFDSLKKATEKMSESDRYVSLIFDEMCIMPSLSFNEKRGCIEGFEDMGNNKRSGHIATHALVFLVRGIKKKFKQPVSYHFSARGGAKMYQIKALLKEIIENLLKIGLKPIATICDQATANVAVLNSLLEDTREQYIRKGTEQSYRGNYFEINQFKVYPIFDPPHLLKGIRNNLLKRNLFFGIGPIKKVAKWSHITALYENDNGPNVVEGLRALPHLTDQHIYEYKIRKMKVKNAAQIFSQRLSSTLILASKLDAQKILGEGAEHTAELLYFFDKLFDSINSSTKHPKNGKNLRCGITDVSEHLTFWKEQALPLLASMEFETRKNQDQKRPPSLNNWSFTIRNVIKIWEIVRSKDFQYLLGRHLNQDPIENMFGQVRSCGALYVNPSPSAFIGNFKTIVVNSCLAIHKNTFNCEDDDCNVILDGLKYFLKSPSSDGSLCKSSEFFVPQFNPLSETFLPLSSPSQTKLLSEKLNALSYNFVAGFILKKIKKICYKIKCGECKSKMFSNKMMVGNELITAREYGNGWSRRLCYPTVEFALCFYNIHKRILLVLQADPYSHNLVNNIKSEIYQNINFQFICSAHKIPLVSAIIKICIRTLVHHWCKEINKKIAGKDQRPYTGEDKVKKEGHRIYLTRKKGR